MKRSWWYRFLFLLLVSVISIMMIIPTVFNFDEDSAFPVKSKINLGLDLQGGLYMILGIDFNDVYKDEVQNYARKIEFLLKDQGIGATVGELNVSNIEDPRHTVVIDNESDNEKAISLIKEYYPGFLRITKDEGRTLEFALSNTQKTDIEEQSVSKSIEVIRNRIDEFGVNEPEIVSQGNDRIIVQLPGVKDIERAKDLIGQTAKLEFKMVNDEISPNVVGGWIDKAEQEGIRPDEFKRYSEYIQALNTFLKEDLPQGYQLAFEKQTSDFSNGTQQSIPYLVESTPRITGEALQDARVQIEQQKNEPYVSLEFKPQGATLFEEVTAENVGNRMAIILDGNVYSAPNIQTRIAGGRAQITLGVGNYNKLLKQARDLALVLRAGALPVELEFREQRTVGPSLGQDSIEKARYASIIGALLVLCFIVFYYRMAGLIAVITLTLNVSLVLACLVAFEATLTLPGIAGIALTIGMAVDASIIIYERIREEIKKGAGNYKSMEGGFNQAFWTIIDANITTALAGFCLLNFGTGPIRGFAVTLLIGIVATIYSAYFVGRLLFELYLNKVRGEELSI